MLATVVLHHGTMWKFFATGDARWKAKPIGDFDRQDGYVNLAWRHDQNFHQRQRIWIILTAFPFHDFVQDVKPWMTHGIFGYKTVNRRVRIFDKRLLDERVEARKVIVANCFSSQSFIVEL